MARRSRSGSTDRTGTTRAADASVDAVLRIPRMPEGPWVYRKMLRLPGSQVPNGGYVALRSRDGDVLARGILNRRSQVAFRVLGGAQAPEAFGDLLRERLATAWNLRTGILRLDRQADAWRVVNAEGDGLSGLTVDRYGPVAVATLYSIGYVAHAEILEQSLLALEGIETVVFQADGRSQQLEGFRLPDPEPGPSIEVQEHGVRYRVRPGTGHKSGLFLDQRDNRRMVGPLSRSRRCLDLCTNAGGFALNMSCHGKPREVVALDLDEKALDGARANARLNKARITFEHADLFPWLRQKLEGGNRFGLIVLDPAKLAADRLQRGKALHTYRDMNTLAIQALSPGGLMLTCSCSGAVSEADFLEAVRAASLNARRNSRILQVRGAGPDHPVALDFPQGRYLKAVLLQAD